MRLYRILLLTAVVTCGFFAESCAFAVNKKNKKAQKNISDIKEVDNLADVLRAAYQNNARLREEMARVNDAANQVAKIDTEWRPDIKASLSPRVGADINRNHTRNGSSDITKGSETRSKNDSGSASVELNQNLYSGGGSTSRRNAAISQFKRAVYDLKNIEQQIFFNVIDLYLNIIENEEDLVAALQSEKYFKGLLENTKAHADVGQESFADMEQAKGKLADSVLNINAIKTKIDGFRADLIQAIGKPLAKKLARPKPLKKTVMPTKSEMIKIAMKENPAYMASQYAVDAADYGVAASISGFFPTIDLFASGTANSAWKSDKHIRPELQKERSPGTRTNNRDMSAGIRMTVPIYAQGATQVNCRMAEQELRQARIERENQRRTVMDLCDKAYVSYMAGLENVASAGVSLESNKVSVEMAQTQYQFGEKSFLEALYAEEAWYHSYKQSIAVNMNLIRACYNVLFSMGRLNAKYLRLNIELFDPYRYYDEYTDAWIDLDTGPDESSTPLFENGNKK